jgi:AraC-like DNA-binding protein
MAVVRQRCGQHTSLQFKKKKISLKTNQMPIYMDRHDVSETVTAENVAQLHQEDLKIQDNFGCRGLTYWFDEKRKTAFCLVEAPNENALYEMHRQAHGQVPNQIIEVDIGVVESFLGRIEDPEHEQQAGLNIIDEPAFRVILVTGFDDCFLKKGKTVAAQESFDLASHMKSLGPVFGHFHGRIVKQQQNEFLVSFKSVSQAVKCAIEIYNKFSHLIQGDNRQINLKTGIGQGIPFSGTDSFFEESVHITRRLFYISNSNIVMSHEVKKLFINENPGAHLDRDVFVALTLSDEKFLNELMNYMESNWKNPNLQVDDLSRHLGHSKSQLYRKMTSLAGASPNSFIKYYRLHKALDLIKEERGNVSEVAYEAGFNSPSYFAKCFYKRYGVHPSEYLQHMQE